MDIGASLQQHNGLDALNSLRKSAAKKLERFSNHEVGISPHSRGQPKWRNVMLMKIIAASVLTLGLATTAMAQTNDGASDATATPTATPDPSVFDKPDTMATFYTDSDMKTMKSDEDFKAAWMAMSKDDQDAVMKGCGDEAVAKEHNDFCANTKKLGGAN